MSYSEALFGVNVAFSFVVWGIVTRQYLWPAIHHRPLHDALRPILLLHSFRFVGLAFLMPGVVSPELPISFARPAAIGDLATAFVAWLAYATRQSGLGIPRVWAFNVLGTADLLYAFYEADRVGVGRAPGLQGAAYFIPTLLVPLLLITHGLVFRLLLRRSTP